ncbi:MAG TPA: nuclear transport factor 2 family protein [Bryobacteraceae bacterium]
MDSSDADESPYIGLDAVRNLIFVRLQNDWDDFSLSAQETTGGDEVVIASGRFRGIFKANGAAVNAQFVQVFQFRDGKILKPQAYTDTAQFKEALARAPVSAVMTP